MIVIMWFVLIMLLLVSYLLVGTWVAIKVEAINIHEQFKTYLFFAVAWPFVVYCHWFLSAVDNSSDKSADDSSRQKTE